jgi:hypothetical protein
MELHPAENRGYRELYAFARNVADHWPKLAERMSGSSAERPLRDGAGAAQDLLRDLEQRTPEYGLYGKPAAQGVGANLANTRRNVRDRFLERNQALRFAVSDVQHIVTLRRLVAGLLLGAARAAHARGANGARGRDRAWLLAGRSDRAAGPIGGRPCRARRGICIRQRRRVVRPPRRRQVTTRAR